MLEFAVAPFLVLPFSCYTLTTFLMLCLILNIYADKAIVYCKCDQASDLWQKLESAAELKI